MKEFLIENYLFRAKRFPSGPWIKGSLIIREGFAPLIYVPEKMESFVVLPETIGQIVNIPDANGNMAYMGDIIKHNWGNEVGVIRLGEYRNPFNDDEHARHFGFYVEWHGKEAGLLRKDVGFWLKSHQVIGNVYDNPDFLTELARK